MIIQDRNYPEDCWWVAASSDEVSGKPLGRWLLGKPVVLYRAGDGTAVALEDRCPHRWAPLSQGYLAGDQIVCGYHGFRFDRTGACTLVPTQKMLPQQARVASYPVVERGGLVWIWLGDKVNTNLVSVPEIDFLENKSWHGVSGYMSVRSNYLLLQENVLDLTHFGFLHAQSLEQQGWDTGESDVTVENGQVAFRKVIRHEPVAPFLSMPLDYELNKPADRIDWGIFMLPGVHVAGSDLADPVTVEPTTRRFRITHLTTPEDMGRTHYWWVLRYDYGAMDQIKLEQVKAMIDGVFLQDKVIVEAIQGLVERDERHADSTEVSVLADRGGLQARRILKSMLQAENTRRLQQRSRVGAMV